MLLGLIMLTFLAGDSMLKALCMAALGVFLGCIGTDILSGMERFTFDIPILIDGLGLSPVAMGLFGIGEVLTNIEETAIPQVLKTKVKNLFPTISDWMQSKGAILRGSALGFFPILPTEALRGEPQRVIFQAFHEFCRG
jgi:putative tricarboxylic transport membrane protein